MKIVYHNRYCEVYSSDPASAPGRIESIYEKLKGHYEFEEPRPASEKDLLLVHTRDHINNVKIKRRTYEIAVLAVGGAMKAATLAMQGEPTFGLIRPPGHHASSSSSWGFCYFNNVAVAIEKLIAEDRVKTALIVDIDLHYGDGTADIFSSSPHVTYFHPEGVSRQSYLDNLSRLAAARHGKLDIVAVSAGFDRHEGDWGGLLKTEDYYVIGKMIKELAQKECSGRRFAVLEGGYNHSVLGMSVKALVEGLS